MHDEVLVLLAAGLAGIDGDFIRSQRVRQLRERTREDVLVELSTMQSETTSLESVRLFVTARQVLTGQQPFEVLVEHVRAVNGL